MSNGIGFTPVQQSVTVTPGQPQVVNFSLRSAAIALEEVVVVGYGTQQRREVSTAVTSVVAEQIVNVPVASLDAALQGRASGVQITQNAGNPGNGITVRVRGASSLSANNQPLYVIDGVPMLSGDYSQLGMGGQDLTAVSGINPDEIASIDILKDAAAASIYGSRGSNGVIIITTKRGQAARTGPRVTFSMYSGTQNVARRLELLNAREYVEFFSEAIANDGDDPAEELGDFDPTVDTNWQDALFRSAPVRNFQLATNGGSERIQYYLSGSAFDQEGVVLGSGYQRASGRLNVDFQATDRLSFRTSFGVTREAHERVENDNSLNGVVTNVIANQPLIPVRLADGTFTSTDDGLEYANPIALSTYNSVESRTLRALGKVEAEFNLTDRLRLVSHVGMDVLNLRDLQWESPRVVGTYAASANGVAEMGNTTASRYVLESFLSWDRPIQLGRLSLTGGASVEYNDEEADFLRGEGFGNEAFRYPGNAGQITDYDAYSTAHNLVSFFSRANLTIKDRYFLTASLRTDGSSRFGPENRYGIFPSASFGWAVTDEPFMEGVKRYADIKVRTSYGTTGNQGIGQDFAYLGRFGKANYAGIPGIGSTSIANPDLKWETTSELDYGLEFLFLGGRIGLTGDYYIKKTSDLLVNRPITATSGQTTWWTNIGNIENRGFEFGLNTINIQSSAPGGFQWTTELNVSTNRNEVTKLFNDEPFNTGIRSINRIEVGHPLGAFHAYRFLGVDPETGDAIYEDLNGDGQLTAADDRQIVGSPHPDYWGGLSNQFSYKGFDLRTVVQFSQGAEVFNAMRVFGDDGGYYFDNKFRHVLKRWQKPGDVTDVPRASYYGDSKAREVSDRFVEDASYIRLQEVTLGYKLPAAVTNALRLCDARIYVSGHNLKLWTDYMGYDPDVNSNGSGSNTSLGTDFYAYPRARTLTIGITGGW